MYILENTHLLGGKEGIGGVIWEKQYENEEEKKEKKFKGKGENTID